MSQKLTNEELLAQAQKPGEDAMILHPFYHGKMQTVPRCCIRNFNDFAIWYSPGVAEPCKAIKADREKIYELTNKWNTVAVVSDGTRVLGLGDIGAEASMPVMEGKALLFKYLGGVDAVSLCLDTKDPYRIMLAVKLIQPKHVIPVHYNTWELIAQDPEAWARRVEIETDSQPHVLKPGETFTLD